ncbi:Holliday junction branch migration protein RuvA [bacterium]|nr:Holliday junction branch migration protein RuvA [bacterium]|tara:strand:+ start:1136 stop:1684 length:549 start_codon:yes stop_codon:yes gene_type:complete
MIAYLEGKVLKTGVNNLILKVSQIGYKVYVSNGILMTTKAGNQLELFIYQNLKEDISDLYGFLNSNELDLFEKLISVNKVGPKSALNIMNLGFDDVITAINNQDVTFLTKASGLGKKGAERIILELSGKLVLEEQVSNIDQEVYLALESLGYERKHISEVLKTKPENIGTIESMVKYFLQNL